MGTGYLTPDTPPDDIGCRIIKLPDDVQFWAVFMGAFFELTKTYNWTKYGTMTEQEAADLYQAAFFDAYLAEQNTCIVPVVVQPPFWDNGTDVDETASEDDQLWYGELVEVAALSFHALEDDPPELTWTDNLGIWLIAGFMAYAGEPAAAIAFVPYARKFVLTFKKATAGAIIRIFFDGLHLADIDTYGVEDELIDFLVDIGVDPEGQELWVEHSGEHNPAAEPNEDDQYTIGVVRQKLDTTAVEPPDTRYDETCGCVQTTYDDGETWVDTPERDPRHGVYYIIPPLGEDFKCEAAGGMVTLVRNSLQTLNHAAEILTIANEILGILAVLTGGSGIIFAVVVAIVEALETLGVGYINDQMDEAAFDMLLCAFYCSIGDDGSVTAENVEQMVNFISENGTVGVAEIMSILLPMYGEVYLQNSGVKFADMEADCTDCECITCDLTVEVSGGGWLGLPIGIIESGIDIRSNGFIYSIDGADVVINFDHEVYVCQWIIDNDGSTATSYRLIVGTEHVDTAPSNAMTIDLSTPQLVDHVTMQSLTAGQGGAFGYTKITYGEP